MNRWQSHPVLVIVLAQLLGTSLWFTPNSAAESLSFHWGLSAAQLGQLTSATQLGFIVGTLLVATTGLAERFRASRVFMVSCLLGAAFNGLFAVVNWAFEPALLLRFAVGISLAGIYPLGMKLIIAWSPRNTGATLGLLVAMLTLGSALPHLVRALGIQWAWQTVVFSASVFAVIGGAMVRWLGDGPHLPPPARGRLAWGAALKVLAEPRFRASASGYFGHMWELYAFWTLLPFFVADVLRAALTTPPAWLPSLLTFLLMGGLGALGAWVAGLASRRVGSPRVAAVALFTSGLMCLVYPLVPESAWPLKLLVLALWGLTVVSDSAQFSATSASVCPPALVGGALAIQNSIGFFITVVSITLVMAHYETVGSAVAWYLLPGPLLGLWWFRRLWVNSP